jgi:hypothetical protein
MATIVLKYKEDGIERIKLFKNDEACDRFLKQEVKREINSRFKDNRAPRTLKRLMSIPKRKQGKHGSNSSDY